MPKKSKRVPIMDADDRLTFLRAIATPNKGDFLWPLCLPAAHHALVISNVLSEPAPSDEKSPESFIVNAYVASIAHAIGGFASSTDPPQKMSLSFRNARLFVLCACRLPQSEQRTVLSRLATEIDSVLRSVTAMNESRSCFLARLITVLCHLVDVMVAGPALLELLAVQTGSLCYDLPRSDKEERRRRETRFLVLFSNWESPEVPAVSDVEMTEPLPREDLQKVGPSTARW